MKSNILKIQVQESQVKQSRGPIDESGIEPLSADFAMGATIFTIVLLVLFYFLIRKTDKKPPLSS